MKTTVLAACLGAGACGTSPLPPGDDPAPAAASSSRIGYPATFSEATHARRLKVPHYALFDANLVLAEWPLTFSGLAPDTYAYNPSLLEHRGRLITVVRLETTLGLHGRRLANRLAATVLDERGRQTQPLTLLETPGLAGEPHTAEDARLIEHQGNIYVVYNMAIEAGADSPHRVHLARLSITEQGQRQSDMEETGQGRADPDSGAPIWQFRLVDDRLLDYRQPGQADAPHHEKNWSPYTWQDNLCFLYRSNPIVSICLSEAQLASRAPVLEPTLSGEGSRQIMWLFGEVRGGSPAVWVPQLERYVTFFHSHAHRPLGPGPVRRHYYTGFYSFFPGDHPSYPLEIDRISQAPIYTPFWLGDASVAPYHIAFAAGSVWRENYVLVSYGRNDQTSAIIALDRRELQRRLAPGATADK